MSLTKIEKVHLQQLIFVLYVLGPDVSKGLYMFWMVVQQSGGVNSKSILLLVGKPCKSSLLERKEICQILSQLGNDIMLKIEK